MPSAPGQTPGSTAAVNAQAAQLASILGNAIAAGLGGGSRPAYGHNEQLAHQLMAQLAAAQVLVVLWLSGAGRRGLRV